MGFWLALWGYYEIDGINGIFGGINEINGIIDGIINEINRINCRIEGIIWIINGIINELMRLMRLLINSWDY